MTAGTVQAIRRGAVWSAPTRIDNGTSSRLARVYVVMSDLGDAALAWNGQQGMTTNAMMTTYRQAGGWALPTQVATAFGSFPVMARDGTGYFSYSEEYDTTNYRYRSYVRRFTFDGGLEPAQPMPASLPAGHSVSYVRVIPNNAGGVLALWNERSAGSVQRFAALKSQNGWTLPQLLNTAISETFDEFPLDGALAEDGSALVAFGESHANTSTGGLFVTRYVPGTGWGLPTTLHSEAVNQLQMGLEDSGAATVVFANNPPNNGQGQATLGNLYAAHWDVMAGWLQPMVIANAGFGGLYSDTWDAAFGPDGDVVVAWANAFGGSNGVLLEVVERHPGLGWRPSWSISATNGAYAGELAVASGVDGSAVIAWTESGAAHTVLGYLEYR